jgi:nicotinate-nucleotide adenylyltransferase
LKLGILGGSFNPVHLGHLFLADQVISALKLDRVVMIPAYRSPFKLDAEGVEDNAVERIEMLAAAVAGDSRLAIDDCEIRRAGVSYTVDTLEDIIARYNPSGKPKLIIGDDLAEDFPKWRDSEKILQLADIVIARRLNTNANHAERNYSYPHTFIDNEIMNISSKLVRKRVAKGSGWKSLVPSAVRAIIEDRKLYGFMGSGEYRRNFLQTVTLRVEAAVRDTLTPSRFLHSRNTALLSVDMCRRFGLDPAAGYLAGIAHDLAKQLDAKHMMKLAKTDGMQISPLEKEKPNLLHGRAAAVLLSEQFYIHNKDILEAVAFHTSGKDNMRALAKVVYIADKLEVSRQIDPALREMCYQTDQSPAALDNIFYAVLTKTVNKLQSRELDLSEDTLKLLERMKERNS